ncbi:MAG: hypothetical protein M0Z40_14610 [Actinomycetota bacterium]|nr:hypothetical protein [Actinomycetota bacterium]
MRSECTDRLLILNEWSIEAIITVAHGLGLRIVAEGVETEAQERRRAGVAVTPPRAASSPARLPGRTWPPRSGGPVVSLPDGR